MTNEQQKKEMTWEVQLKKNSNSETEQGVVATLLFKGKDDLNELQLSYEISGPSHKIKEIMDRLGVAINTPVSVKVSNSQTTLGQFR